MYSINFEAHFMTQSNLGGGGGEVPSYLTPVALLSPREVAQRLALSPHPPWGPLPMVCHWVQSLSSNTKCSRLLNSPPPAWASEKHPNSGPFQIQLTCCKTNLAKGSVARKMARRIGSDCCPPSCLLPPKQPWEPFDC